MNPTTLSIITLTLIAAAGIEILIRSLRINTPTSKNKRKKQRAPRLSQLIHIGGTFTKQ